MCGIATEQPIALECVALKTCSKCHVAKMLGEFCKTSRNKDGLQSRCKECGVKEQKASREKNKARETVVIPESKTCPDCKTEKAGSGFNKKNSNKDGLNVYCKECASIRNRKRLYGATPEWIKATLEAQGGACAICKFVPGPGDRGLCLDHKHGAGPRGFLHGNCNLGLGHFKDSVEIIRKAIDYLNGPTTGIVYKESWKWGVPAEIKDPILASQNYLCKICSVDLHNKRSHTDHDHLTMMIRGCLCNGCNVGLGYFDDSVVLLINAIGYLQRAEEILC